MFGQQYVSTRLPVSKHIICRLVPRAGIEPARPQGARDFKSLVSTSSTTQALKTVGELKIMAETSIIVGTGSQRDGSGGLRAGELVNG